MNQSQILITEKSKDYELLDSGDGEKLERFGTMVLSRPDPQALWRKRLSQLEWKKADGHFTRDEKKGDWSLKANVPDRWPIEFGGLKLWIKPTAFKHVGLFPEQQANWEWMRKIIRDSISSPSRPGAVSLRSSKSGDAPLPAGSKDGVPIEVLNLFGYTGAASLVCAAAGAKVVHVDGSKVALTWARENAEISSLKDKPIRWILDDAHAFVHREVKRGRKYHGIIMDPPAFGHGPENELWKIEEHFLPLIDDCMKILHQATDISGDMLPFFLINGYSAGYSAVAYENNLLPLVKRFGGVMEKGELAVRESGGDPRLLPCGIFARWSAR